MTYDQWKTTNPRDYEPEWQPEEPDYDEPEVRTLDDLLEEELEMELAGALP